MSVTRGESPILGFLNSWIWHKIIKWGSWLLWSDLVAKTSRPFLTCMGNGPENRTSRFWGSFPLFHPRTPAANCHLDTIEWRGRVGKGKMGFPFFFCRNYFISSEIGDSRRGLLWKGMSSGGWWVNNPTGEENCHLFGWQAGRRRKVDWKYSAASAFLRY